MKILLLVASCLILHVQAQYEDGVDEQPLDLTDLDIPDEEVGLFDEKAIDEQQLDVTDPDIPDEEVGLFDENAISMDKRSFNYNCACGRPNPYITTINPLNHYPWALQLTTLAANGKNQKFFCGAVMISNKYALSSASCFENIKKQVFVRLVLVSGPQAKGFIRPVTFRKHPAYNPITKYADIAVIKFKRIIKLGDGVSPICMLPRNYVFTNRTGYFARWGHLTGGLISDTIQIRNARILSNAACQKIHPEKPIYKTNLCAGRYIPNSTVSCQSDYGGQISIIDQVIKPNGTIVNRHKLAGVASYGYGCRFKKTAPGVYTRIAPFLDFIYFNTLDSEFCGMP